MPLRILAFAIASEQLGFRERSVECIQGETPRALLARLHPSFDPSVARVAFNCEYLGWDDPLEDSGELAILPPVSGG